MYKGPRLGGPRPTNAAVDGTSGQVVRYQGSHRRDLLLLHLRRRDRGRGERVLRLAARAVPQERERSLRQPSRPRHQWQFTFTRAQLESKLHGLVKGHFKAIKILSHGVSPRVVSAQVGGHQGLHPGRRREPSLATRPLRHLVHLQGGQEEEGDRLQCAGLGGRRHRGLGPWPAPPPASAD